MDTQTKSTFSVHADSDAPTLEQWAQAGLHRAWMHSGIRITLRIPDLATLIRNDAVPVELMGIALREVLASNEDGKRLADQVRKGELREATELVNQIIDLQRFLAVEAIVEPEVTLADVEEGAIPAEDLELIRQIAMRERSTDAKGVVLGVLPLDAFTTFRDLHAVLAGEQDHPAGLVESCPACQAFVDELSSLGAGAL
jgi:hypothetical protein